MPALGRPLLSFLGLMGLSLTLPAQATVTPYGVSCGPVLSGDVHENPSHSVLTLRLNDAEPHAPAVMVIGVNPLVTPLPLSNCMLLTEAIYLEPCLINGAGKANIRLQLPSGYSGEARVQIIEMLMNGSPAPNLISSNGVHLVVPST